MRTHTGKLQTNRQIDIWLPWYSTTGNKPYRYPQPTPSWPCIPGTSSYVPDQKLFSYRTTKRSKLSWKVFKGKESTFGTLHWAFMCFCTMSIIRLHRTWKSHTQVVELTWLRSSRGLSKKRQKLNEAIFHGLLVRLEQILSWELDYYSATHQECKSALHRVTGTPTNTLADPLTQPPLTAVWCHFDWECSFESCLHEIMKIKDQIEIGMLESWRD